MAFSQTEIAQLIDKVLDEIDRLVMTTYGNDDIVELKAGIYNLSTFATKNLNSACDLSELVFDEIDDIEGQIGNLVDELDMLGQENKNLLATIQIQKLEINYLTDVVDLQEKQLHDHT